MAAQGGEAASPPPGFNEEFPPLPGHLPACPIREDQAKGAPDPKISTGGLSFVQALRHTAHPPLIPVQVHIPAATDAGEPATFFTSAELQSSCKPLEFTIMARTLRGRPPYQEIRAHLTQRFAFTDEFILSPYDGRHMIVYFQNESDYLQLLLKERMLIRGRPFEFFRWEMEFTPSADSPIVPVWLELPRLPLNFYFEPMLRSIAGSIGKVLQIHRSSLQMTKAHSAVVCVEMDVSRKLPLRTWIGVDAGGFWQAIHYPAPPRYCSTCRRLGHLAPSCKQCPVEGDPGGTKPAEGPPPPSLDPPQRLPKMWRHIPTTGGASQSSAGLQQLAGGVPVQNAAAPRLSGDSPPIFNVDSASPVHPLEAVKRGLHPLAPGGTLSHSREGPYTGPVSLHGAPDQHSTTLEPRAAPPGPPGSSTEASILMASSSRARPPGPNAPVLTGTEEGPRQVEEDCRPCAGTPPPPNSSAQQNSGQVEDVQALSVAAAKPPNQPPHRGHSPPNLGSALPRTELIQSGRIAAGQGALVFDPNPFELLAGTDDDVFSHDGALSSACDPVGDPVAVIANSPPPTDQSKVLPTSAGVVLDKMPTRDLEDGSCAGPSLHLPEDTLPKPDDQHESPVIPPKLSSAAVPHRPVKAKGHGLGARGGEPPPTLQDMASPVNALQLFETLPHGNANFNPSQTKASASTPQVPDEMPPRTAQDEHKTPEELPHLPESSHIPVDKASVPSVVREIPQTAAPSGTQIHGDDYIIAPPVTHKLLQFPGVSPPTEDQLLEAHAAWVGAPPAKLKHSNKGDSHPSPHSLEPVIPASNPTPHSEAPPAQIPTNPKVFDEMSRDSNTHVAAPAAAKHVGAASFSQVVQKTPTKGLGTAKGHVDAGVKHRNKNKGIAIRSGKVKTRNVGCRSPSPDLLDYDDYGDDFFM